MTELRDMALAGVTLAQFALVRAGLIDGLRLDELLAFAELDTSTWEAGEEAWDDQVLDAMEEGPALLDAIDEATAEARTHWTRRLPPFDEELRAWLDLVRAWASAPEPQEFLAEKKLGVAELAHLHRLWSERLAKDAKLQADALRILGEEPAVVPAAAPERPRFLRAGPPPRGSDGRTVSVARARTRALPFLEGETAGPPPPLAVPLPRPAGPRRASGGPDETRLGRARGGEQVMPFFAVAPADAEPGRPAELPAIAVPTWLRPAGPEVTQELPAAVPADPEATTAIDVVAEKVIPVAEAFERAAAATPQPLLAVEAHARLVAELTSGGDLGELLARYGLTPEAKESEDARWAREIARDPETRRAWMRAFDEARRSGGEGS
jgi:hypothetical protein